MARGNSNYSKIGRSKYIRKKYLKMKKPISGIIITTLVFIIAIYL